MATSPYGRTGSQAVDNLHENAVVAAALGPEEEWILSRPAKIGKWAFGKPTDPYANELLLMVGLLIFDCLLLASLTPRSSSDCLALELSNSLRAFRAKHRRSKGLSLP